MYPTAADIIGSVGNMGAYLAQTIPGVGQLTDTVERIGIFFTVALIAVVILFFVTRSTAKRSDAEADVDRNNSNTLATLVQQFNAMVARYLEDSSAWRVQQERFMKMGEESNAANLRVLAELTEAIKQSSQTEVEGRTQAVKDLKIAFVEVHEETMDGFKDVTEKLSEIEKSLTAAGERLLQVADKEDVKAIGEMIRELTTQVEEVKIDVGKLKDEKEIQHEETTHSVPADPDPPAPADDGTGTGDSGPGERDTASGTTGDGHSGDDGRGGDAGNRADSGEHRDASGTTD